MITAKFVFSKNDLITGFEISGHSGSAISGEDIICSAVSSPSYMVANTITDVLFLKPEITEKDGFMKLNLKSDDAERASDILNGFYNHIKGLEEMYPHNIKVERGAK